jgi:DNA-binding CsgD family transcriptional regulator
MTCVLTKRQRELRDMLLSPASGTLIQSMLCIRPSQYHNMSKDVYRKLGYRNRHELIAYELRHYMQLVTQLTVRGSEAA